MKKNKNKIISIVISAFMTFVLTCGNFVSAAEAEERLYTLDELLAMSDEEFLAMETTHIIRGNDCEDWIVGPNMYEFMKKIYLDTTGNSGMFVALMPAEYKANITEQKISELLGDSVEYELQSPINPEYFYGVPEIYYNNFMVMFPEYSHKENFEKYTEDDIMKLTKCWYCIMQVEGDLDFMGSGITIDIPSDKESIIVGDVNVDRSLDLYDAIWIGKNLAGVYEFTDYQNAVGDMNNDGRCDFYDLIAIAKTLVK